MRVLSQVKDTREFDLVIKRVHAEELEVCLWQKMSHIETTRVQYRFLLKSFSKDPDLLNFDQVSGEEVDFKKTKMFFYCEGLGIIFSSNVAAIGKSKISLFKPDLMFLLNEDEKELVGENDLSALAGIFKETKIPFIQKDLTLKKKHSEDEIYKNVRETPRGKAQDYKLVKVAKDVGQTRFEKDFQLYDLSQGGMGVFCKDQGFFEVDLEIEVLSVGLEVFDLPVKGIVRSVNQIPGEAAMFKVGIQFLD
jgi:hypothetical protein